MFKVIVIASDGSEAGQRAMAFAKDIAIEQKARLLVVHVDELVPGRGGAQHSLVLEPEMKARMSEQVDELTTQGVDAAFEVRQVMVSGPAHAIAEAAVDAEADLIVVGTVGKGPLKGLLLGSVAQRLLQIAPCPVLVVPKAG